ncbi:polyadenylate-binding protein RBP47-like [Wolffia australiana]
MEVNGNEDGQSPTPASPQRKPPPPPPQYRQLAATTPPPPLPPPWMSPIPHQMMMIPHQMAPPPHFLPPYMPFHAPLPYHHLPPPPPPSPSHQQGSSEENRTIWVGDLQFWMDEGYLQHCFGLTGEVVQLKVIRNKQTGQSEGYGFVEFYSHSAAEKVLQMFNGVMMPNTDQFFRINWAAFSMGDKRVDTASDHSIFVGDLAADVTDTLLQETFSSKYSSVKGAKVVIDVNTGRSKGYGFVRFGDENEKSRALTEMNGVYCSSRAMRVGAATPRKSSGSASTSSHGSPSGDSTNTTLFIGGLDPDVSEEELRQAFTQHGEIATVKIPAGKQCGFVQFVRRNSAEEALQKLNGITLGKQTIRISWGRNPINKQFRAEPAIPWSNAYYGGQLYDAYGYAVPPPIPATYSGAYAPYYYGNQQQVS